MGRPGLFSVFILAGHVTCCVKEELIWVGAALVDCLVAGVVKHKIFHVVVGARGKCLGVAVAPDQLQ